MDSSKIHFVIVVAQKLKEPLLASDAYKFLWYALTHKAFHDFNSRLSCHVFHRIYDPLIRTDAIRRRAFLVPSISYVEEHLLWTLMTFLSADQAD
jgi:hypothetical protein